MKLDWIPGWRQAHKLFHRLIRTWGMYPLLAPGIFPVSYEELEQRAMLDQLSAISPWCRGAAANGCLWSCRPR